MAASLRHSTSPSVARRCQAITRSIFVEWLEVLGAADAADAGHEHVVVASGEICAQLGDAQFGALFGDRAVQVVEVDYSDVADLREVPLSLGLA